MSAGPDGAASAPPDPADVDAFRRARERVLRTIDAAAARAGRSAADVTLVAVSKTVDVGRVRAAVAAGLTTLGENRVQEAAGKVDAVPGATWHLVGPLQANKARRALDVFDAIQTVDSLGLAARLDRIVREIRGLPAEGPVAVEDRFRVLLQANVDADAAKAGYEPATLERELDELEALEALELAGLMTVGRLVATPTEARATFVALRRLSERLRARPGTRLGPEISMGMSGDYAVAVEEGATIVRVGTALFGARSAAGGWRRHAARRRGPRGRGRQAGCTGLVTARIRVRLTPRGGVDRNRGRDRRRPARPGGGRAGRRRGERGARAAPRSRPRRAAGGASGSRRGPRRGRRWSRSMGSMPARSRDGGPASRDPPPWLGRAVA